MRAQKPKRKTRRDILLFAVIFFALAVAVVAIAPLVLSAHYLHEYKEFEMDMVHETVQAKKTRNWSATLRGEPVKVTMQQIEAAQVLFVQEGPGIRDRKEPLEEGLRIRLGDAQMILAPQKLHGSDLKRETGVQIRYIYASGKVFAYDTDEFNFDQVLRMFGLS